MSASRSDLWKLLNEYSVEIPILQRDYAQGRETKRIKSIREKLLDAICTAVKEQREPLELDFVYGYSEDKKENGVFCPLDGQQRLTTLFLFYWYIAVYEDRLDDLVQKTLAKFTYEVRHSSREFCAQLVKYQPEHFDEPIKDNIQNQPWFFAAWQHDPTVRAMLTMLNAIQHHVAVFELKNVWPALVSDRPPMVFHLLPMEVLGQSDDLYIKMNSRGKELTNFEHFKARFSEFLKDKGKADQFNQSIDREWTDLFWGRYRCDDQTVDIAKKADAAFMRFFNYLSDMIAAGMEKELQLSEDGCVDEFSEYEQVYDEIDSIEQLFTALDLFADLYLKTPDFFNATFYSNPDDFVVDKTRLFITSSSVDLFKNCIEHYDATQRVNPFALGEQLLLYACLLHLRYQTSDFSIRIRKLRNLISNSEDTVRREYFPSLLKSVYQIIVNDNLRVDSRFSTSQIEQENRKTDFLLLNPQLRTSLYLLEDHYLLQGSTDILDLNADLDKYTRAFWEVFAGKRSRFEGISRALMTFGDYSQKPNSWSHRFGNRNESTWRELFTPSTKRKGFDKTKDILKGLLDDLCQTESSTAETVIEAYLEKHQTNPCMDKDFNYYYIKYEGFRERNEDGYYYWPDKSKPYEAIMMRRKTLGGFFWNPFLRHISDKVLSKSKPQLKANASIKEFPLGPPLILVKDLAEIRMKSYQAGYFFEAVNESGNALLESARHQGKMSDQFFRQIQQSVDGYDIEDRIPIGIDLVEWLLGDFI